MLHCNSRMHVYCCLVRTTCAQGGAHATTDKSIHFVLMACLHQMGQSIFVSRVGAEGVGCAAPARVLTRSTCVPLACPPLCAIAPQDKACHNTWRAMGTPNRNGVQGRGRGSGAGGHRLEKPF